MEQDNFERFRAKISAASGEDTGDDSSENKNQQKQQVDYAKQAWAKFKLKPSAVRYSSYCSIRSNKKLPSPLVFDHLNRFLPVSCA